jgi:hypothetical protein
MASAFVKFLQSLGCATNGPQRRAELGQNSHTQCSVSDWVFPCLRLKGRQPRVAEMLVEDYLRPAAVKLGILFIASGRRRQIGR